MSADRSQLPFLLDAIQRMHGWIRQRVAEACEPLEFDRASEVVEYGAGDFVYAIDRVSETELVDFVSREIASVVPVVLVGEGLPSGKVVLPVGADEDSAPWRMIVDPIDGTRGLMFQKRSAWILTGVAPDRGPRTDLRDIRLAVQTEIPLATQYLSDQVWAIAGEGVGAVRWNRFTDQTSPLTVRPSAADSLRHGYATVCRFFPGGRDILASIDDGLAHELLGPRVSGEALVFEDQYACTGGQLYGLMSGKDRFVADLRPLLSGPLRDRGESLGHCCHPYDLCTMLIAIEAGVIITDASGEYPTAPLDTSSNVTWIGYANRALQQQVQPILERLLREHELGESP